MRFFFKLLLLHICFKHRKLKVVEQKNLKIERGLKFHEDINFINSNKFAFTSVFFQFLFWLTF